MQPELVKRKTDSEPETQLPYKFRDPRARAHGYMYNMTQYCRDNVEQYLKAVGKPATSLRRVATPFIDESRGPSDITVAVDSPESPVAHRSGATRFGGSDRFGGAEPPGDRPRRPGAAGCSKAGARKAGGYTSGDSDVSSSEDSAGSDRSGATWSDPDWDSDNEETWPN